jgi:hypothetical protein
METRIGSSKNTKKTAVDKKIPLEKQRKINAALDHVIRGLGRDWQKFQSLNNIYTNFSIVTFNAEIELKRLAKILRNKEQKAKTKLNFPDSYSSLSAINKNLFNLLALEVLSNNPSPLNKTGVPLERSGEIAQAIESAREGGTRLATRSVANDADKLKPFPFTLRLTSEMLKQVESNGVVGVAQQRLNSIFKYHMKRKVQFLISLEIKDDNPHFHGSALISENEIEAFKISLRRFNKGVKSKKSKFSQNEISYKKERKSREHGLNVRGYVCNAIYFHAYITKQSQTLMNCYSKIGNKKLIEKLRKLENIHNHIDGGMLYASIEIETIARKIYSQFLRIFNVTQSDYDVKRVMRHEIKEIDDSIEWFEFEAAELSEAEIKLREEQRIEEKSARLIYFKSREYQEIRLKRQLEKDYRVMAGFTDWRVAQHYGID